MSSASSSQVLPFLQVELHLHHLCEDFCPLPQPPEQACHSEHVEYVKSWCRTVTQHVLSHMCKVFSVSSSMKVGSVLHYLVTGVRETWVQVPIPSFAS